MSCVWSGCVVGGRAQEGDQKKQKNKNSVEKGTALVIREVMSVRIVVLNSIRVGTRAYALGQLSEINTNNNRSETDIIKAALLDTYSNNGSNDYVQCDRGRLESYTHRK